MGRYTRGDGEDLGRRTRRHPDGAARGGARRIGALPALIGLLLLAGCGGGDMTEPDVQVRSVDVNLEAGDVAIEEAEGVVLRAEFPSASSARSYIVAVQAARTSPGATPVQVSVSSGDSQGSGSVRPSVSVRPLDRGISERWTQEEDLAARVRIQTSAKQLLQRRGVRPARRTAAGGVRSLRSSSMLPDDTPSEGDEIDFWYPVQEGMTISCDTASAEVVTGEVMAEGERVIMVEDTAVNSGLLPNPMSYDSLAQAFDDEIFGTDVQYFGNPSDIDGNGRTYVLFTNKVNALSDPEEEGIVTGFFLPTDLADSGDEGKEGSENVQTCPASNEAEVLYLLAPDPDGSEGDTVSVATAKRSAGGTSAHEFQHLLNAANRVIKQSGTFNDLEDTWLDEGLSHLAEEVVGLGLTEDPIRSNLTIDEVTAQDELDAFNTFHLPNFARLAEYMRSPGNTQAVATQDPSGLESLKMRGFAWSFVRWLTDQEATASSGPVPGSGEEGFVQDLAKANGGLEFGVENIETVTGRDWEDLLSDYGLMPPVDDTVSGVRTGLTLPTWNLRDIYLGLHENSGTEESFPTEYPLAVAADGFSADTTVDLRGGTQSYFFLESTGSTSAATLELSSSSGTELDSSSGIRLLILRTR